MPVLIHLALPVSKLGSVPVRMLVCINVVVIFTALHVMQTRSSDENSVCPSVCLSVCLSVRLFVTRVYCDKTEERSVQIFIPYERTFILVF